jgi:hypothetical protein
MPRGPRRRRTRAPSPNDRATQPWPAPAAGADRLLRGGGSTGSLMSPPLRRWAIRSARFSVPVTGPVGSTTIPTSASPTPSTRTSLNRRGLVGGSEVPWVPWSRQVGQQEHLAWLVKTRPQLRRAYLLDEGRWVVPKLNGQAAQPRPGPLDLMDTAVPRPRLRAAPTQHCAPPGQLRRHLGPQHLQRLHQSHQHQDPAPYSPGVRVPLRPRHHRTRPPRPRGSPPPLPGRP